MLKKRNIFKHFVKSKNIFFASIHLRSNRIKLCTWAGPWCQFPEADELLAGAAQQLVAVHKIGAEALELLRPRLRIRIHFIRIQHFRPNTDPDPGL